MGLTYENIQRWVIPGTLERRHESFETETFDSYHLKKSWEEYKLRRRLESIKVWSNFLCSVSVVTRGLPCVRVGSHPVANLCQPLHRYQIEIWLQSFIVAGVWEASIGGATTYRVNSNSVALAQVPRTGNEAGDIMWVWHVLTTSLPSVEKLVSSLQICKLRAYL